MVHKDTNSQKNSLFPGAENHRLGDFVFAPKKFDDAKVVIAAMRTTEFTKSTEHDRYLKVCSALLKLIQNEPDESFALGKIIDFIDQINLIKLLDNPFNLSKFEFFLNQFSALSEEENYKIRGKISGKWVPRANYQPIFPVGQGQKYFGSHIVAAHHSPDVDTMIASFWGWLDAFSCRLGRGLHIWSVPGGTPECQVSNAFRAIFGEGVFRDLARPSMTVTLSSIDLATQEGVIKKRGETLISDLTSDSGRAIILVDDQGYFLGDWRSSDVEGVRQVIMHFSSCLRWFENNLHATLILLFAKKDFQKTDLAPFVTQIFGQSLDLCDPVKDLSEAQLKGLDAFLRVVFGIERGIHGSFDDFGRAIGKLDLKRFGAFEKMVEQLGNSELFDPQGRVVESRPVLFTCLERIINELDAGISEIRRYLDRLDVAVRIKQQVLKISPQFVSLWADVEQIRTKMEQNDYLPVVQEEQKGKYFPVGIVRAADVRKQILGTVSLRDFSNFDEIKMASYLEVISVVDHHKSALNTTATPMLIIGDAQSSNVLVAEQTILLNDQFSLGGGTVESIDQQLAEVSHKASGSRLLGSDRRIQQRLLTRHMRAEHKDHYYVHPEREFVEYLFFLYAILDDTDLLSKVTVKDVECVANLMNRLKSLMHGKEVEIINFEGIPRDGNFAKMAAKRLLQSEELYSIYKKSSEFKEVEVRDNLMKCSHDQPSTIFADTKEQNGCCRVGQTKIFNQNYADYLKFADKVRMKWYEKAVQVNEAKGDVDLHMHMVSTVVGAEEVYRGGVTKYGHRDELWIWIPSTGAAQDHLIRFLTGWKDSAGMIGNPLEVAYLGGTEETMSRLITRSVGEMPVVRVSNEEGEAPIVVLYYNAGSMNSRKSNISPFLPKLVS